jgi:hypothetical protein
LMRIPSAEHRLAMLSRLADSNDTCNTNRPGF